MFAYLFLLALYQSWTIPTPVLLLAATVGVLSSYLGIGFPGLSCWPDFQSGRLAGCRKLKRALFACENATGSTAKTPFCRASRGNLRDGSASIRAARSARYAAPLGPDCALIWPIKVVRNMMRLVLSARRRSYSTKVTASHWDDDRKASDIV